MKFYLGKHYGKRDIVSEKTIRNFLENQILHLRNIKLRFSVMENFSWKRLGSTQAKTGKSNNSEYWINKIDRNRKRDHEIDQELLFLGWTVIRFWGKDIKKNLEECVQVVEETVFEVKMSWDEYEE